MSSTRPAWVERLRRLFNNDAAASEVSSTRRSKDEVLAIARRHVSSSADASLLSIVSMTIREDKVVWIVSEAVMGSALVVEIDDATAEVIAMKRVGVR